MTTDTLNETIPAAAEKIRLLAVHSAGAERADRYPVTVKAPIKVEAFYPDQRAEFVTELCSKLDTPGLWADANGGIHVSWVHVTKEGTTVYPEVTVA